MIPLFCARFLEATARRTPRRGGALDGIRRRSERMPSPSLSSLRRAVELTLSRPRRVPGRRSRSSSLASLPLYAQLRVAFFPRTDASQFMINLKAQSGTRLEVTEEQVRRVEALIRQVVAPEDLDVILSNIGVTPGFSSIYTSNSAQHTAFVQVNLHEGHGPAATSTWSACASGSGRRCRS